MQLIIGESRNGSVFFYWINPNCCHLHFFFRGTISFDFLSAEPNLNYVFINKWIQRKARWKKKNIFPSRFLFVKLMAFGKDINRIGSARWNEPIDDQIKKSLFLFSFQRIAKCWKLTNEQNRHRTWTHCQNDRRIVQQDEKWNGGENKTKRQMEKRQCWRNSTGCVCVFGVYVCVSVRRSIGQQLAKWKASAAITRCWVGVCTVQLRESAI